MLQKEPLRIRQLKKVSSKGHMYNLALLLAKVYEPCSVLPIKCLCLLRTQSLESPSWVGA